MPLAVQSVAPALAALAADSGVTLQPGTVVTAKVLQVLDADLVRIAIANMTVEAATMQPLQQGQMLRLAVAQTPAGFSLTPVPADDVAPQRAAGVIVDDIPLVPRMSGQPPATTLTASETQAVTVAAQTAVTRQAGLSPLFANLSAAMESGKLPQPVLQAAAQVLGLRVPADAKLTGADIKAAVQASGLTMETTMASPMSAAVPDMKAALLVLRHALATWAAPEGETSQGQPSINPRSLPAAASAPATPSPQPARMNDPLMKAVLPDTDLVGTASLPVSSPKSLLTAQVLASALRDTPGPSPGQTVTAPPPVRGTPPTAQPVASPSLVADAEPQQVASRLLADTEGALARQTLLQIASLPDRADLQTSRNDATQPRWNFEIPFVTPQGTAMAQFEIARDGGGVEAEAARRIWRARFSLDVEPAGPIHALIAFGGDTTSVKMWAERPATAAQLRANASELTQSLGRAELKTGDIVVADGAPARGKVASGHFLNRAS